MAVSSREQPDAIEVLKLRLAENHLRMEYPQMSAQTSQSMNLGQSCARRPMNYRAIGRRKALWPGRRRVSENPLGPA